MPERSGDAAPFPTRLVRRLLFHAALAGMASPLPGGLLVAARLIGAGKGLAAAAALGVIVVGGLITLAVALLLPIPAPTAGPIVCLIAVATGLALAWLERIAGPEAARAAGPRRLAQRATLWGLIVPVVWIPVAWMITLCTGRWGAEVMLKPSLQGRILVSAVVWLLPLGVILGLVRGFLGRHFSMTAPLVFAATLPVLALSIVVSAAGVNLLQRLWLLPPRDAWPSNLVAHALRFFEYGCIALLFLAAAEYMSDARSVRAFLLRSVTMVGVLLAAGLHAEVMSSALPVSVREMTAYRRMARDDDSAAAGEWAWVIRRAPVAPGTCRAVEQCAVSALRSGDSELARWALGRARGDLIAEFPCETTARTAAAILATPLDTRGALAVNTPPIRPESYLSDNWCAVLTAVRAARPELSEVRLKNRLQAASYSPDEINLPPVDGFDDLRWAVRLLGAEPLVVASDRIEEMLGQGRPVLFRDPVRRSWGVVVWAAPKSDAVLWLDYGRWDRDRERPLSQAEVRQLVSSAEPAEQDRGRVRAEVSRLGSMSLLRASLAVDGDWAVAVVPRARDGTFTAPPGAATHGDALALLWQARHAVEKRAYLLGTRLAGRLAAGRPRDEILAIGALGLRSLGPPDPARRPSPDADRAAAGLLRPGGLEGLSPWALREIDEMAARLPAVSCESHREALERLRAWDPDDAGILERLLARAPIEGSGEETVRLALDMTRAKSFSPDSILWALRVIALSKPETPAARGALVALIRHIPILVPDAKGMPGSRANLAPYCAARAALSAGPREAVAWWRRATEIDPKNFPYQRRLAEALAAAGETAEAATARARQQELAGVERCGGGPDEEGATGEEETDDGEGLMTREAQR